MANDEVPKSPSRPPYPEMILAAIDALNMPKGSNKLEISKHIRSKYGESLPAHAWLLNEHLARMEESGELIIHKNNYFRTDKTGFLRPIESRDPMAVIAVAPVPPAAALGSSFLDIVPEQINKEQATYADEPSPKESARHCNGKAKAEEKPNAARNSEKQVARPSKQAKTKTSKGVVVPALGIEPILGRDFAPDSCIVGEQSEAAGGDVQDTNTSWKLRVKNTLRDFTDIYFHFVQEEQRRAQEIEEAKALRLERAGREEDKAVKQRPDLKTITKMRKTSKILFPEKRIGQLPGIDVGDQFYSRAELVVLGIHSHWLNGIDYIGHNFKRKAEYENFAFPFATCIVMSGVYEDDLDNSEEIIYTGQGGNDLLGNKRQIADQKMERGNLALKNSMDNGNAIRVVRGHEEKESYTGKVYTYDGLYKVVECLNDKGRRGHLVFKYRLKRLQGQAPLTITQNLSIVLDWLKNTRNMSKYGQQVKFAREVSKSLSEIHGLACPDISQGQEKFSIPATNLIDDSPIPPSRFVYSTSLRIPTHIKIPVDDSICCNCEGDCADNKNCSCARRNGSSLPYVLCKNAGRLVEVKAVIFECGANCSCNADCVNRTSQQGLKYRLEVFKTIRKGWCVRSWDTILPRTPICEYTGALRRIDEIDTFLENNYIFHIDCLQTMQSLDGRKQHLGPELSLASLHANDDSEAPPVPEYCIDAGMVGSVARFINHSCQPNLFVQCVLSSHNDFRLAKLMLFAADTIPPLQELTYDYGYRMHNVVGFDGNVKLACHCSAPDCRKQIY